MTETNIGEQADAQTIDARLWQDPFAAVARIIEKLGKSERGQQCLNSSDKTCNSPLDSENGEETLVIGVTVSGAPYSEDAEQRRRTRYAVLAGLERAGFVPSDARHIGYFWFPQQPQTFLLPQPVLSPAIPPSLLLSADAYTKWYDPNKLALTPIMAQLPPVALSRQSKSSKRGQDPDEMAAIEGASQSFVPFEWFEMPQHNLSVNRSSSRSILLLWLKEESLKKRPLQKVHELKTFLHMREDQRLKIIGPYSSDILQGMVREACLPVSGRPEEKCAARDQAYGPDLKDVNFYAYGASVPDAQLLGTIATSPEKNRDIFENLLGLHLQRTIASDDTLASGLVSELKLRNVKVGPDRKDGDLALISEWDTFYGQTLPKAVEAGFGRNPCKDGTVCWIHKLTYLRGLDGLTPMTDGAEDRRQDKSAPQDAKPAGAAGFFKTQTDLKNLDRPVGQGQFDYLRRMSRDLHKTDDELRKKGRRLQAIGILGSDVFDKLLVLRALRPEFPEALFFTTDFDEAFTIESELPWTRNLVIASSFGSKLTEAIQGGIPSFRSSYQTSAFLATLAAIGNPANHWATPEGFSDDLARQLSIPRIFEISRTGEVLSFTAEQVPVQPMNYDPQPEDCPQGSGSCNPLPLLAKATTPNEGRSAAEGGMHGLMNIQPDNEKLFPTFEESGRKKLALGLAVAAFLALALLYFRKVPKDARVEVGLVGLGLAAGALASVYWEQFAEFVTDNGKGEPILMLQGVSVWPTVLLRGLGIILSLYFIWRAQSGLHDNLREIADEMHLEPADKRGFLKKILSRILTLKKEIASFWRERRFLGVFSYLRKTITSIFDYSLDADPDQTDDRAKEPRSLQVKAAWKAYVGQERFWSRRFWRALTYTLAMFMIFRFVIAPMLGQPTIPARGILAYNAYWWTTRLDVILMLFLTFFVFDATCFCLLFVNKLRRAATQWPLETIKLFEKRMQLQPEIVHDWIDLEFVAKRTRCIGWLIYYPFVLIALLIISRSSVFANYAPSSTILVAQGISLSVVFGCAIMLWWAATSAREATKQSLTDKIIRLQGPSAKERDQSASRREAHSLGNDTGTNQAPCAEEGTLAAAHPLPQQKDIDDNPRYAEQLETLLRRVEQLRDGAFGPFTQQPLVRAVILPMGSFGWTVFIENGLIPGL
ncbi:hypothetical protein CU048_14050 [Beijerinckiaceae bacterium]|nr:hypothetical protein CU048_14050 [Beijerinckiaceae bacterium]